MPVAQQSFQFWFIGGSCAPFRIGENKSQQLEPSKLKSNTNLVKFEVEWQVFRHAEYKSGIYFGLSTLFDADGGLDFGHS